LGAGAVDAAAAAQRTLSMAPPLPPPPPPPPPLPSPPPPSPPPPLPLPSPLPSPLPFASRPRVAIVLGNESRGVSRLMLAAADVRFFLPQAGFTQSFNVSVACGLALSAFLHRTPDYAPRALAAHLVRANGAEPPAPLAAPAAADGGVEGLSDEEVELVLAKTLLRDVPSAAAILDRAGVRPLDY
jgi:hypothetical protein